MIDDKSQEFISFRNISIEIMELTIKEDKTLLEKIQLNRLLEKMSTNKNKICA